MLFLCLAFGHLDLLDTAVYFRWKPTSAALLVGFETAPGCYHRQDEHANIVEDDKIQEHANMLKHGNILEHVDTQEHGPILEHDNIPEHYQI